MLSERFASIIALSKVDPTGMNLKKKVLENNKL
jgi:hypothetical protein